MTQLPDFAERARAVFGISPLRAHQQFIVERVLRGQDSLGILPTGSGKSLCYQLPAILLPGLTLVISPLLSLMDDQVAQLQARGVVAAAYTSRISAEEKTHLLAQLTRQRIQLLFCSPEALWNAELQKALRQTPLAHVCIDEAHCLSIWGHDFRPEYRRIHEALNVIERDSRAPRTALTATATSPMVADIIATTHLHEPGISTLPSARPNLALRIHHRQTQAGKFHTSRKLLRAWHAERNGCAVVFCATRRETEQAALAFQADISAPLHSYHAGMDAGVRQHIEHWFRHCKHGVLFATSAFGMGVDKPNIRMVLHLSVPASLLQYAQEFGRASRDGNPGICHLLYRAVDLRDALTQALQGATPQRHAAITRLARDMERYSTGQHCLSEYLERYFSLGRTVRRAPNCQCSFCHPEETFAHNTQAATPTPGPHPTALYQALAQQRNYRAKQLAVPAYFLGTNRVLEIIAQLRPQNWRELRSIAGLGSKRLYYWGNDILTLTQRSVAVSEPRVRSE